jgi:flavin reductase (DIM6/NTAB) family NADH-FMN oxidoreductase RutF
LFQAVINIISEHFVEAANATSINAPFDVSEWALTGLHAAPTAIVKPARVQEAVFSIEAKLVETKEFTSKVSPDRKTGVLAILEGVRFWVREDALNETRELIDPNVGGPSEFHFEYSAV